MINPKKKIRKTDLSLILGNKQLPPSFLSALQQLLIENLNKVPLLFTTNGRFFFSLCYQQLVQEKEEFWNSLQSSDDPAKRVRVDLARNAGKVGALKIRIRIIVWHLTSSLFKVLGRWFVQIKTNNPFFYQSCQN